MDLYRHLTDGHWTDSFWGSRLDMLTLQLFVYSQQLIPCIRKVCPCLQTFLKVKRPWLSGFSLGFYPFMSVRSSGIRLMLVQLITRAVSISPITRQARCLWCVTPLPHSFLTNCRLRLSITAKGLGWPSVWPPHHHHSRCTTFLALTFLGVVVLFIALQ